MAMRLQSWQVNAPFPGAAAAPVQRQVTSCAVRDQLMRTPLPGRMAGSTSASPAALRGQKSHSAVVAPSGTGVRYQVPQPQVAPQTSRARPSPQEYATASALAAHRRQTQSSSPAGSHSLLQQHQQVQSQYRGAQQVSNIHTTVRQNPPAACCSNQLSQDPLQQLGVHYQLPQYGGSTSSSAPQRGAVKKKNKYERAEDDSDDDVIGPGCSFSQSKQRLLVTAITFIRDQISSQRDLPVPEACRHLAELFCEEQYYHGKPPDQVHQCRQGLNSSEKGVVAKFILDILDNGYFDVSELICSLVYLRRLQGNTQLRLRAEYWRPLFITALLFADKVTEDKSVKNSSMCELFPVLHEGQLFELEVAFLKKLDFRFLVDRLEFQAFCKELLNKHIADTEVESHVRQHGYIRTETFTWIDSSASGQQQTSHSGLSQHQRLDKGAPNIYTGQANVPGWRQSGASCPVGTAQRSHSGSAGASSRVAPQPQWNARRTLHTAKRNGQASATGLHPASTPPGSAAATEDEQMDKTPPVPQDSEAEHNRKAELNGVSPRRPKASPLTVDNGLGAVQRETSAAHSQPQIRVGEPGEQHLAQANSSSMLHQGGSRPRLAANQSPRRTGLGASGPLLRSGGGSTPTAQVQQPQRQEASPRDQDPSTLSFADKKEMYSGRGQSEPAPSVGSRVSSGGCACRAQHMPTGHSQSQVLNRGGVLQRGQQVSQVQQQHPRQHSTGGIVSGMAVQGAQGGAAAYGGYPLSRSTLPNTRAGGSAARPALASPAGIVAGSVPGMVQQGGHPQAQVGLSQNQVLQAARGRSSSPAYTAGIQAQPYSPARQHYVQYHR
eukprot:TRINITY_DN6728_c0_g1_i2.p1 TRINITY_DN6728_c0_g1~~TRINITY_DN6728_c0_g1_i2.p1  ORF type:complete len:834 (-),score=152.05 TRINITY_DN6728_c0_g1_i2:65-2566(-)